MTVKFHYETLGSVIVCIYIYELLYRVENRLIINLTYTISDCSASADHDMYYYYPKTPIGPIDHIQSD